ncbi:MAG: type II toxin-antitoxin system RelE/ParE family toxin [Alphaproteobacteria bacterium]|nr:type II toxin-antitoxin system RelE/ParE family toxin [Alphaproteobacteria bacterium]
MEVSFDDTDLDELETNPRFFAGFSPPIVKGFRKVMQAIRSAKDERDLYKMRGLRFEKLQGDRQKQHSLRINDQMRLIVEIRESGQDRKIIAVIEIVDYH